MFACLRYSPYSGYGKGALLSPYTRHQPFVAVTVGDSPLTDHMTDQVLDHRQNLVSYSIDYITDPINNHRTDHMSSYITNHAVDTRNGHLMDHRTDYSNDQDIDHRNRGDRRNDYIFSDQVTENRSRVDHISDYTKNAAIDSRNGHRIDPRLESRNNSRCDRRSDADYIFSSEAIMKPGTLV